jgi:hypothetical protein
VFTNVITLTFEGISYRAGMAEDDYETVNGG